MSDAGLVQSYKDSIRQAGLADDPAVRAKYEEIRDDPIDMQIAELDALLKKLIG